MHGQQQEEQKLEQFKPDVEVWKGITEQPVSGISYERPTGSKFSVFLKGPHASLVTIIVGLVSTCALAKLKAPWFSYLTLAVILLATIAVLLIHGKTPKPSKESTLESGTDSNSGRTPKTRTDPSRRRQQN